MTLLGHWDDPLVPSLAGAQYSDVISYEQGGREYAIIGGIDANYVIEVTSASTPVVRATLTGPCLSTRWRDHAIYQNYLYTINDNCGAGGLQVWDLSPLPAAPTLVLTTTAFFTDAHSIEVNPVSGRLYVVGTNINPNGPITLEVLGHPAAPTQIGSHFYANYVHDIYVFNDTVVAFIGNQGINTYDMRNISGVVFLDHFAGYPEAGYAHSGCGINNNKNLVWTDETAGKSMKVGSMSDIRTLAFQTLFKSALLAPTYTNSTAHNPTAKGNLVYSTYYEDGLQIWDVSTPTAPVRVGYYDTQNNTVYNGQVGAWGVDVSLSSGKILVSDTQNGLFILSLNAPFPISLQSFDAKAETDRVKLVWNTASELNNERFVVQRSADGINYESILETPGAGTSNDQLSYSLYDFAPLAGVSYYRLKQVDYDGNSTLSNVVSVNFVGDAITMSAAPCPAQVGKTVSLQVSAQYAAHVQLAAYDLLGKQLHTQEIDLGIGQSEIALPTAQWAAGTYLLSLTGDNLHLEQKLLIVQ